MLVIEKITINTKCYVKHFSDNGSKLLQNETGQIYDEAVDLEPCKYTYSEVKEEAQNVSL